jgi:hypothetical protein
MEQQIGAQQAEDTPAPSRRRGRRAVGAVAAVVVMAAGLLVLGAPASFRDRHERRYCRSQSKAIVANHQRLIAEGHQDPFYEEHFVVRQDYMERCLAVQRCQRHGLLGLEHGPRKGCLFATVDVAGS